MPQFARAGAPAGNHVLNVDYNVSSYGRHRPTTSRSTRDPQDWSGLPRLPLLVVRHEHRAAAARLRPADQLEVKDGGANAEASELWTTSFTDDWEGWHLVEIPFSQFVYRGDYQPVGGIDHVLDLTAVVGLRIHAPSGRRARSRIDDFQVYGVAPGAAGRHGQHRQGRSTRSTRVTPRPCGSRLTTTERQAAGGAA